MYAWIWRHLPFGLKGKIIGSLLLITATFALLWYVIFPWAEPLLPFDDVQVTQNGEVPGDPGLGESDGDNPGSDQHDLPYETDRNNPVPTSSR